MLRMYLILLVPGWCECLLGLVLGLVLLLLGLRPPCQITRLIPPLTEGLLEMAKFAKFLDKMAPVGASSLP